VFGILVVLDSNLSMEAYHCVEVCMVVVLQTFFFFFFFSSSSFFFFYWASMTSVPGITAA
jgi:hypothetical protein